MEWNRKENKGTLHACGNGKLCCYLDGPDLIQLFGPCYSSPNFVTMNLIQKEGRNYSDHIEQDSLGGVFYHALSDGQNTGTITEFVHAELPVYIQSRILPADMEFRICLCHKGSFIRMNSLLREAKDAFLAHLPAGTLFYGIGNDGEAEHGYAVPESQSLVIAVTGDLKLTRNENADELIVSGGSGELFFSVDWEEPDAISGMAKALAQGTESAKTETLRDNLAFHARRKSNRILPDKTEELLDGAMFDVAQLIRVQQGAEGGVLAGHNYHLAYVRDQLGVMRGLLSLGCFEEVKRVLLFYLDVFSRRGRIHNAQGIGVDAFHVHENDEVEITGYLVIGVLEYACTTGDYETLVKMMPLVRWAMEVQAAQLCHGMLSFNGDETYVAGGIIPRSTLMHGSCEATLLYHTSIVKLLPFLKKYRLTGGDWIERQEAARTEIEKYFRENFIIDQKLYCNQPALTKYRKQPARRHGVRECGHGFFGWCYPNGEGRYVCPECVDKYIGPADNNLYLLNSVALMPYFAGSRLVPEELLTKMVSTMLAEFNTQGRINSLPGQEMALGYDYGMLLNAAAYHDPDTAKKLFDLTLSVRDDAGSWSEYYKNGIAERTRLRPWESGINIWALTEAAEKLF